MNKRQLIKIGFHISFWLGWILFYDRIIVLEMVQDIEIINNGDGQIIDQTQNVSVDALPLILVGVLFKAFLSYLIISKIKRWFLDKNMALMVVFGLMAVIGIFTLETLADKAIIGHSSAYQDMHFVVWKNSNYLQYFILIALLISYLVIERLVVLDKKYLQMEKEKLHSELSFLKYQLNPHLLFNILNNLFSMSQASGADDVSDGLLKLSKIMRYMLYENKESKIPLNREIEFLKQYIDLQRLRESDDRKLRINFEVEGDILLVKIPPFLLVPFIENAFKHGVDSKNETVIDIDLKVLDNNIIFKVVNKIFRNQQKLGQYEGGIGINNLKKRLDILFPNTYILNQYEENGMYISILKLKL